MRSKKYWALARENGELDFGSITSWLDNHPKWNVFLLRSLIYLVESFRFSMRIYRKNPPKIDKKLAKPLLLYFVITFPLSFAISYWGKDLPFINLIFQVLAFSLAVIAITMGLSDRVWKFHGAEHKAVNAFEAGADINDRAAISTFSRIHQRCGTNLVFLIIVLLSIYVPTPNTRFFLPLTGAYSVLAIGLSVELFKQLMRFPRSFLTRVFLFPGGLLQKFVTTKEPDGEQVEVAARALRMVLALEGLGRAEG